MEAIYSSQDEMFFLLCWIVFPRQFPTRMLCILYIIILPDERGNSATVCVSPRASAAGKMVRAADGGSSDPRRQAALTDWLDRPIRAPPPHAETCPLWRLKQEPDDQQDAEAASGNNKSPNSPTIDPSPPHGPLNKDSTNNDLY